MWRTNTVPKRAFELHSRPCHFNGIFSPATPGMTPCRSKIEWKERLRLSERKGSNFITRHRGLDETVFVCRSGCESHGNKMKGNLSKKVWFCFPLQVNAIPFLQSYVPSLFLYQTSIRWFVSLEEKNWLIFHEAVWKRIPILTSCLLSCFCCFLFSRLEK